MRRGFTLVELLVATGVFLFGFTAALGLFLVGTRARSQADGILRLSLAASSLVEEFRLEAGRELASGAPAADVPYKPSAYVGDGFAFVPTGTQPESANEDLYPYKPQPGIWYRVLECVDEKGSDSDEKATALQMDLLIVWNPLPDDTLTLSELARRQGSQRTGHPLNGVPVADLPDKLATFLAQRGFALRERAVIIRRASWER
jgi:prepilin-type N-terminal cleavage/methylation domain-containing protein